MFSCKIRTLNNSLLLSAKCLSKQAISSCFIHLTHISKSCYCMYRLGFYPSLNYSKVSQLRGQNKSVPQWEEVWERLLGREVGWVHQCGTGPSRSRRGFPRKYGHEHWTAWAEHRMVRPPTLGVKKHLFFSFKNKFLLSKSRLQWKMMPKIPGNQRYEEVFTHWFFTMDIYLELMRRPETELETTQGIVRGTDQLQVKHEISSNEQKSFVERQLKLSLWSKMKTQ